MALHPDELHDPVVVAIDDDFSRLPDADRRRVTQEWVESLRTEEPLVLSVSGAQMVAEARTDMGW